MSGDLHDEFESLTEEHLEFAALSDGLGFNKRKATDTAKAATTSANMGTGAEAAGPARPALGTAPKLVARTEAKAKATLAQLSQTAEKAGQSLSVAAQTLGQSASSISQSLGNNATTLVQNARAAAQKMARAEAQQATVLAHVSEPGASTMLRLGATLLDLLFISSPLYGALHLNFSTEEIKALLNEQTLSFIGFYAIYVATYFLLTESFGGQSLAKMWLGLQIVEDDKYQKPIGFPIASKRLVFAILGLLPLGLGFFSAIWESKSRAWHDKVTASIVRKRS